MTKILVATFLIIIAWAILAQTVAACSPPVRESVEVRCGGNVAVVGG